MDSESERIFERMKLHRLMRQHPDWSVRQYAVELGHTPKWVRTWMNRFRSTSDPNFSMYLSRSRAPKHRPRQTSLAVKKVIGDIRQKLSKQFHRNAGPALILAELHRRHDLKAAGHFVPTSTSTITRILHEMGYITPRQRPQRIPLVLPAPMAEWEMDFGEIRLADDEWLEFFLVVDRGTSRVVYLEGCLGYHAESALEAVARLFILHGLPKRLRFDRDPRFVGSWTGDSYASALVRFLRALGVGVDICPPRRPDLKPFVERCIRTLKEEWFARLSPDNLGDAINCLPDFCHYYNSQRPHLGRACRGQTPDAAFPHLPPQPTVPEFVDPDGWLQADHGRVFRRRVTSNGTVMIDKHTYFIDNALAGERVLIHLDADRRLFHVTHNNRVVKQLAVRGLHGPDRMDFQTYLIVMRAEARSIERHRQLLWMRHNDVA